MSKEGILIDIVRDFTDTPGYRYKSDGEYSGEEFRENFLEKLFDNGKTPSEITIILDGGYGYSTSFLEEAFGGLARRYGEKCLGVFSFVSEEEPALIEEIQEYMEEAVKQGKREEFGDRENPNASNLDSL